MSKKKKEKKKKRKRKEKEKPNKNEMLNKNDQITAFYFQRRYR